MRLLITGGAGFIGSSVAKELNNEFEIYIIDNLSFGNRQFVQYISDEHFFNVDILDKTALEKIVGHIQPDYILHFAAIHFIPYCNAHPFESANINIQGTNNIFDCATKVKSLKGVLFASTAAVYPIVDAPISEEIAPAPTDIYGLSKLSGEIASREFHLRTGIPVTVCRFFNAFGPNETNPHLIPEIQKQLLQGVRNIKLGNLTPKRDFIHTTDIAKAIRLLLLKGDTGFEIFNLGSGEEYSVVEIVEYFQESLGEKIQIEVDESRIRKVERQHLLADITKLKSHIDWKPYVSIKEGLNRLLLDADK